MLNYKESKIILNSKFDYSIILYSFPFIQNSSFEYSSILYSFLPV